MKPLTYRRRMSLIEWMIIIAIIGILSTVIFGGYQSFKNGQDPFGNATWGINGMVETRCVDGFKFVVGQDGSARQIMDGQGKGVACK